VIAVKTNIQGAALAANRNIVLESKGVKSRSQCPKVKRSNKKNRTVFGVVGLLLHDIVKNKRTPPPGFPEQKHIREPTEKKK
jgi:hypothetical protein